MKTVSILGCGWLGKALGESLMSEYSMKVSVQSESSLDKLEFSKKFLINDDNDYFEKDFYKTDVLVIAIPPKKNYIQTLEKILSYTDEKTHLILCSSTSVYTQTEGEVFEKDSVAQEGRENILILRLGGLMGYERIAGKYSAGKSLEYDAYVNYIHRDDVVNIIKLLIKEEKKTGCYNIVAPIHSSKKEIYDNNAAKYGFEKTIFKSEVLKGKKVSSAKFIQEFNYVYLKENPLLFW